MRASVVKAIFVGLLLAPVASLHTAAAQGNPEAAKIQNPVQPSPESIAAGKQAFTRYCANCHGLNAEGSPGNDLTPEAPNLTDKEWKHGSTDGEIFSSIKNGIALDFNMGAFGDQLVLQGLSSAWITLIHGVRQRIVQKLFSRESPVRQVTGAWPTDFESPRFAD